MQLHRTTVTQATIKSKRTASLLNHWYQSLGFITHKYSFENSSYSRKLINSLSKTRNIFGRNCGVLASQICHRCREQCLACEDHSACSVCKGVRMLTRQDGDLLERIAQIFRKRLESRSERNVIASMCSILF